MFLAEVNQLTKELQVGFNLFQFCLNISQVMSVKLRQLESGYSKKIASLKNDLKRAAEGTPKVPKSNPSKRPARTHTFMNGCNIT